MARKPKPKPKPRSQSVILEPSEEALTLYIVLINRISEVRRQTEARFPFPNVENSIDFALSETVEYLDLNLRAFAPSYIRNHEEPTNGELVMKELSQALWMTGSAIVALTRTDLSPEGRDLAQVGLSVGLASAYLGSARVALQLGKHEDALSHLGRAFSILAFEGERLGYAPERLLEIEISHVLEKYGEKDVVSIPSN